MAFNSNLAVLGQTGQPQPSIAPSGNTFSLMDRTHCLDGRHNATPMSQDSRANLTSESREVPQLLTGLQTILTSLITSLKEVIGRMSEIFEKVFLGKSSPTSPDNNIATVPMTASHSPKAPTGGTSKTTPTKALNGSGEFLWKPESDKDGKLAVLLPSALTGKVKSVEIVDANNHTLATGSNCGAGNGNREHYRFSKPGGSYPDGVTVRITLNDGSQREVEIKDTAKRTTK